MSWVRPEKILIRAIPTYEILRLAQGLCRCRTYLQLQPSSPPALRRSRPATLQPLQPSNQPSSTPTLQPSSSPIPLQPAAAARLPPCRRVATSCCAASPPPSLSACADAVFRVSAFVGGLELDWRVGGLESGSLNAFTVARSSKVRRQPMLQRG